MKKNRVGEGIACVIIIMWILVVIAAFAEEKTPRCIKGGCDDEQAAGSSYCYLHRLYYNADSYDSGTSSYSEERDSLSGNSTNSSTSDTTGNSTSSSSGGTLGGNSGSSSGYKSYSSSSYKYNSNDSYDDGYDDVYFDEDYDWDRYQNDDDYARGVDDAMEDEDW